VGTHPFHRPKGVGRGDTERKAETVGKTESDEQAGDIQLEAELGKSIAD